MEKRTLIFIAALASVFITAIESTIVATAMPTIVASLGGFELLSWVFTAYLLTQAITIPIYGRLSDLYGRKPILLIGTALFLIGSLLCGFAWSMFSLVMFRLLQGLGAGALTAVGRTLIGDVYQGADRARMQGYVSSVFVSAAVLGPVVGAFLVAHTIWPMVFWVNLPLCIGAGAILIWALHEKIERRRHRIDYMGSALLCLSTGLLMIALAQADALGALLAIALGLAALALLVCFVFYERFVSEPIWPMNLWRDRVITSGNIVSVGLGMTMMGIAAYLPIYVQGVMNDSAFVAGMTLMGMSAAGPLGAFTAGRIMLRHSFRTAASIGGVVYILGCAMMTLLDPQSGPPWAIASGLFIGFGMGMNNNTYMVAIQSGSGWSQRGIATSTIMFSRILGQAIGAAMFGGILNAQLSHYLSSGGDLASRIMTPELRQSLPPEILQSLLLGFDQALHLIFVILVGLAIAVFLVGMMLPKGRGIEG
jgi:EmrB/QacA subfamily drug resistance transporter